MVSATVRASAADEVINTVTVTAPNGVTETNLDNNEDDDVNTLVPGVDLQITKTNNTNTVTAGGPTTYTIVVTNNGPNPANGALIEDDFDPRLLNVMYTSNAAGGATGNTNGSGDINDTVNMPVGSSITYTVQATVAVDATGTLTNTATVTAPDGTVEISTTNNSAGDTDTINVLLADISGFVFVDLDQDGLRDATEPGIPGVQVLLEQNNAQLSNTTTGTDGGYQFTDLTPGTYQVVQVQPTGFDDGEESVGGGLGSVVGNDRFQVTVGPGDAATLLNFGELSRQPSKRSLLASSFRN
jgi:uncharacterized repeat protein (TIGR01451 family)